MSYTYDMAARRKMEHVLTLRLSEPASRRLREHARDAGKTTSAFLRDLLERELGTDASEGSLADRTSAFVGVLDDPRVPRGRDARAALDGWRPDRRG